MKIQLCTFPVQSSLKHFSVAVSLLKFFATVNLWLFLFGTSFDVVSFCVEVSLL